MPTSMHSSARSSLWRVAADATDSRVVHYFPTDDPLSDLSDVTVRRMAEVVLLLWRLESTDRKGVAP